jgi:signal transduction histidine kinase
MDEPEDPGPLADAPSRRRRRRPVAAEEPTEHGAPASLPPSRWQRWRSQGLASWGLSPAFRAYVFVGAIITVLAFLLYSEFVIQEFREQERDRVELYAFLYALALSPTATPDQAEFIFREVINNPKVDWDIVLTDHRDGIVGWKGSRLPEQGDDSPAAKKLLAQAVRQMDASNEPIKSYSASDASGNLFYDEANVVVTEDSLGMGDILAWSGWDVPDAADTTAAALARVREELRWLRVKNPTRRFKVPVDRDSYLYYGEGRFVIADRLGQISTWSGRGLPSPEDTSAAALARVREAKWQLGQQNEPRLFRIHTERYIHYGESGLVSRMSWVTFAQIGVLLLFFVIGYIGFRNIRRVEQRSIWVGMAKETAHQLGTPLSSMAGWLELMASQLDEKARLAGRADGERLAGMVGEMQRDMERLNQIASRFSQIGSVPELEPGDVRGVLEETAHYFRSRGPHFGQHDIRLECRDVPLVPMNAELLRWAFENLFKNAIDAIGGRAGTIAVRVAALPEGGAVQIAFQDNGRGIEPENTSRIFEPGFSTKKRGWGLGLAFVKRIVEEYHKGRIHVQQSAPGEGTTFEILLPTA